MELDAAGGQFRGNRRVTDFKPRQPRRGQTGYAQGTGWAVGKADIGIGPRGKRVFVLSDFKPVVELQRHQAAAARAPVEINRKAAGS